MIKNKVYSWILLIIILISNCITVYGADQMARFMHNDHDALVIGEITEVFRDQITMNVHKQIVSKNDLNSSRPKKQISIDGTIKVDNIEEYMLFHGNNSVESRPKKGDYVLVSMNQKVNKFTNAWGIYKLDAKEYDIANILYPEDASMHLKMDAFAIKQFLNSDGKETDFSFDGSAGKVYLGKKLIYDATLEKEDSLENRSVDTSMPDIESNESPYTANSNKKIFLLGLLSGLGIAFVKDILKRSIKARRRC